MITKSDIRWLQEGIRLMELPNGWKIELTTNLIAADDQAFTSPFPSC
jgi:hypothetical protein